MSGGSRGSYDGKYGGSFRDLTSDDAGARRRAEEERSARVNSARRDIDEGRAKPPPARPVEEVRQEVDTGLARNRITAPTPGVKRVHVVLVDNSGSNESISIHLMRSSDYFTSMLHAFDHEAEVATIYFSDHCDGARIRQDIDYLPSTPQGGTALRASIACIKRAGGGDAPEAIECALWDACDLDFGEAQERHLYLVTDMVAHGMGLTPDDGCPLGRSWKDSLKRVRDTFTSFQVIGSGNDSRVGKLQAQFLAPERLAFDLIDLSGIPTHNHRCGITGNSLLFLMARHRGLQTVEAFLMTLYEKWLDEPIFGANTELGAREAITRFTKFLDVPEEEKQRLLTKIFT